MWCFSQCAVKGCPSRTALKHPRGTVWNAWRSASLADSLFTFAPALMLLLIVTFHGLVFVPICSFQIIDYGLFPTPSSVPFLFLPPFPPPSCTSTLRMSSWLASWRPTCSSRRSAGRQRLQLQLPLLVQVQVQVQAGRSLQLLLRRTRAQRCADRPWPGCSCSTTSTASWTALWVGETVMEWERGWVRQ